MKHDRALDLLIELTDSPEIRNNPDMPLWSSGLLDSINVLIFIVEMEEEYGIEIAPVLIQPKHFESFATITQLIESLISSCHAGS